MTITVDDLKQHMNITDTAEDQLLTTKIEAATAWIGRFVDPEMVDMDDAPAPVLEAIRQLAAALYEQREAVSEIAMREIAFGVTELIAPYRAWAF